MERRRTATPRAIDTAWDDAIGLLTFARRRPHTSGALRHGRRGGSRKSGVPTCRTRCLVTPGKSSPGRSTTASRSRPICAARAAFMTTPGCSSPCWHRPPGPCSRQAHRSPGRPGRSARPAPTGSRDLWPDTSRRTSAPTTTSPDSRNASEQPSPPGAIPGRRSCPSALRAAALPPATARPPHGSPTTSRRRQCWPDRPARLRTRSLPGAVRRTTSRKPPIRRAISSSPTSGATRSMSCAGRPEWCWAGWTGSPSRWSASRSSRRSCSSLSAGIGSRSSGPRWPGTTPAPPSPPSARTSPA